MNEARVPIHSHTATPTCHPVPSAQRLRVAALFLVPCAPPGGDQAPLRPLPSRSVKMNPGSYPSDGHSLSWFPGLLGSRVPLEHTESSPQHAGRASLLGIKRSSGVSPDCLSVHPKVCIPGGKGGGNTPSLNPGQESPGNVARFLQKSLDTQAVLSRKQLYTCWHRSVRFVPKELSPERHVA